MKTLATLLTAFALFLLNPAAASTTEYGVSSIDKLAHPLLCAEDEKKTKKGEEDEEPECD